MLLNLARCFVKIVKIFMIEKCKNVLKFNILQIYNLKDQELCKNMASNAKIAAIKNQKNT